LLAGVAPFVGTTILDDLIPLDLTILPANAWTHFYINIYVSKKVNLLTPSNLQNCNFLVIPIPEDAFRDGSVVIR
jgi:hypothetical protein